MKRVSVVILNWNGGDMLRRFLPSVISCSEEDGVEVCVADNASTDDSCHIVSEEFPSVRLIRLAKNYGFAEGYNRALETIDAEYSLLLNSDVEVSKGWLLPLLDYMDKHPYVGACQPKLLSERQRKMFEYAGACGGYLDRFGYPFCRGRIMGSVEADMGQYDDIAHILWATGAALCIRTSLFREVGGLDARFFAHMEEVDLCWRLRSRGWKIVCIPLSVVYHVGGATLNKENPRKTYLNFRNNLLMLYKNLPDKEYHHVMRIRFILDCVATLQFLLKGDFANFKAVCKARKDYRSMKPDYADVRAKNLASTTNNDIPERTSWSILWRYYALGKRRFSELDIPTL